MSYPTSSGPPSPPNARRSQPSRPSGPSHAPRSGAHRPRRPIWHDVLPAVVVLLAVGALIFGIYQLKDSVLGSSSTSSSGPDPGSDDDNQPAAPTGPTTTGSGSATTSGKPTSSPTKSVSPTSTATPTVVDRAATVKVYNSTSRTGLAKGAAAKLDGRGWSHAGSAGNQHGFGGSTTVFYAKAAQRATARAVAKDLGGYAVQQSSSYGSGIVVVLANDYQS